METTHEIHVEDARSMDAIPDDSVELVVTSPPYPMIEMWDGLFTDLDAAIGEALEAGEGSTAFELMHEQLRAVWEEVSRVLVPGGIACINVGDATRKIDGNFRVYQNHARIVDQFDTLGFEPLPEILWRKPVNSGTKFMGSGMIPPNAYVTLEHEYILVFRNGVKQRSFEPGAKRRYEAAYFWEERNTWFSDVWMDITGELQELGHNELRDRSAAFPFEVPYRLLNMYSVYGDTVLDPFWGTGTTSLAALVAGRNSIGYELEPEFTQVFDDRVETIDTVSESVVRQRLESHEEFVSDRQAAGNSLEYTAEQYEVPVTTKQERQIRFYVVTEVTNLGETYKAVHKPIDEVTTVLDS